MIGDKSLPIAGARGVDIRHVASFCIDTHSNLGEMTFGNDGREG